MMLLLLPATCVDLDDLNIWRYDWYFDKTGRGFTLRAITIDQKYLLHLPFVFLNLGLESILVFYLLFSLSRRVSLLFLQSCYIYRRVLSIHLPLQ